MSRYTKDISRNRTHQAYSAEGFFQECFKTHEFMGFEPTKKLFEGVFINQVSFAVCVFKGVPSGIWSK